MKRKYESNINDVHGHAWILKCDAPSHNRSCLSGKVKHTIKKTEKNRLVTTVVVFQGKLSTRLKKPIPLTLVSPQKNAKRVWSMSMFLSYVFTILVVFTACVDFKGGTWCSSVATQSIVGLTPVIYV